MPQNLHITVPRLGRNRHGVFFVRAPSFVDETGRRRVVQQSLRTKDPSTAKLLALEFCLKLAIGNSVNHDHRHGFSPWVANLGTGEFKADGEDDHKRMMEFLRKNPHLIEIYARKLAAASVAPPVAASVSLPAVDFGRPLKELAVLHLQKEASSVESEQTVHEKKVVLDEFMAVFGENTGIRTINAEKISSHWIPVELRRPNKKYQGKTLSRSRLEKRRSYLSKFFAWAKTSAYYPHENPMALKMFTKQEIKAQTKSYAEFNTDDLAKLFSADYKAFMCKPDWFWPPLLSLFSGARLGEICNLQISAISVIEGVKTYEILDGKTPDSERVVPIHSILIKLGFWDYVEQLRAKGETFLFPDRSSRKAVAKALGRRWGLWVDECGITDKRKVFHSFRSTAITDLHNASAGAAAIRKAVGHTSPGIQGAHGGYVRGPLLRALVDAINKLEYSVIDFDALKLNDPTFSSFFEASHAKKNSFQEVERARKKSSHLAAKTARLAQAPSKVV